MNKEQEEICSLLNSQDFGEVEEGFLAARRLQKDWISPQLPCLDVLMRLNLQQEAKEWKLMSKKFDGCTYAQRLAALRLRLPSLQFPFNFSHDYWLARADSSHYTVYADDWHNFDYKIWAENCPTQDAIRSLCHLLTDLRDNKIDKQRRSLLLPPPADSPIWQKDWTRDELRQLLAQCSPEDTGKKKAKQSYDYLHSSYLLDTRQEDWAEKQTYMQGTLGWTCIPISVPRPKDEQERDYSHSINTRALHEQYMEVLEYGKAALAIEWRSAKVDEWILDKGEPRLGARPYAMACSQFLLIPRVDCDWIFEGWEPNYSNIS